MLDLYKLSIKEILDLIRSKEISVYEVCEYFIDRINNSNNNSVCIINPNYKREIELLLSKGDIDLPLYGIPYLVKDNIDVYGLATTAGSVGLSDNYPSEDAFVVKRLRECGAIILGKCNMMELANYIGDIPDGYSSYGGSVLNAYNKELSPGGSSSGSGSAMAEGLCPFTLGTDTSYSVIACASLNGVFGFKPNPNNMNNSGVFPITKYCDSVGVFSKRFDDLYRVIKCILNIDVRCDLEIGKYVGIDECLKDRISREEESIIYNLVDKLIDYGFEFKEINNPYVSELYELMKRDYAISVNDYLKNSKSKIKSFSDLVNFYHENKEYCKYGCDILDKALELFNDSKNNELRINELLENRKKDRIKFINNIELFDSVIETFYTSSIHYYNVPSISIPVCFDDMLGIPKNIVLYSEDESKLLSLAKIISDIVGIMPYPNIVLKDGD